MRASPPMAPAGQVSALFISYDGLLDPVGGSQVLPYVKGLARDYAMHVLSFEKSQRYAANDGCLSASLALDGIGWTPLRFTQGAGKAGKLWDLLRMYIEALRLQHKHGFAIVHCRSYPAAQVGCLLKMVFGPRIIFDMRGLWVDERMDTGLWDRRRFFDRMVYAFYKWIERRLLTCADFVVALTERSVPEIRQLAPRMFAPISVIPCSADFDAFSRLSVDQRRDTRRLLGLPDNALVLTYLGSLGTRYQFNEMLDFFRRMRAVHPDAWWLIISREWTEVHESRVATLSEEGLRERIVVRSAERAEMPSLVGVSDLTIGFIRSRYSTIAASPIKMGESLAVGVPTIASSDIGDVDALITSLNAGVAIDPASEAAVSATIEHLAEIIALGGHELRERSRPVLGLESALERYRSLYGAAVESIKTRAHTP